MAEAVQRFGGKPDAVRIHPSKRVFALEFAAVEVDRLVDEAFEEARHALSNERFEAELAAMDQVIVIESWRICGACSTTFDTKTEVECPRCASARREHQEREYRMHRMNRLGRFPESSLARAADVGLPFDRAKASAEWSARLRELQAEARERERCQVTVDLDWD